MKTWEDYGIIVPHGASGEIRCICPKCSHERKPQNQKEKDLAVNIDKKTWVCFHCSWSGGLGMKGSQPKAKTYHRPDYPAEWLSLPPKAREFFAKRGISPKTCATCRVGFQPGPAGKPGAITFPRIVGEEVVAIKFRGPNKTFWQSKDPMPCFWNYDNAMAADGDTLVIVEGEMDGLTLVEVGIPATVSVPNGAPPETAKNVDQFMEFLTHGESLIERFQKIVLFTDDDAPGQRLKELLAERIGVDKCWRVTSMPEGCKDANDVLLKHGASAVRELIIRAKPYPIDGLFGIEDISDSMDILYESGISRGKSTGWKTLDEFYTVMPGYWTLITGVPAHGKALSIYTEIPTPSGFKSMGEIEVGDIVYSESGEECQVIKTSDIMINRQCYEVKFDDGSSVIADENHQWLTLSEKARRSLLQTRYKRGKREVTLPRGTDQRYKKTYASVVTTKEISSSVISRGKFNHQIEKCLAIRGQQNKLKIPPYVLGAWLGDGDSSGGGFTCFDVDILDKIKTLGFKIGKHLKDGRYTILGLKPLLTNLSVLFNKHIPTDYKRASIECRKELLRGLMDTDGSCRKADAVCEYTSTNKLLAEDVYELACSLGIKTSFLIGDATINGRIVSIKYRVCFSERNIEVFTLKRKLLSQRVGVKQSRSVNRTIVSCDKVPSVPVRCIQVNSNSKLFLATKAFIPTHNSTWLDALCVNLWRLHKWKFAFCSPESLPIERHAGQIAEKIICKPFMASWPMTPRMSVAELNEAKRKMDGNFFFVMLENMSLDGTIETMQAAVSRYGVNGVVLDPWNEIEYHRPRNINETEYISQALSKLRRFARLNKIHLWLVAHPTKMKTDEDGHYIVPRPYDVSGSAHFANKADNAICIYRRDSNKSETEIHIQKIRPREVGRQGVVTLGFQPAAQTFIDLSHDGKKTRKKMVQGDIDKIPF